jgi:hypothetical protein
MMSVVTIMVPTSHDLAVMPEGPGTMPSKWEVIAPIQGGAGLKICHFLFVGQLSWDMTGFD